MKLTLTLRIDANTPIADNIQLGLDQVADQRSCESDLTKQLMLILKYAKKEVVSTVNDYTFY
jgi:hypothetical protein